MNILYGISAKDGDYVLVQDVAYMKGTATISVAQVHNGKAYAALAVPYNYEHNVHRWIRKETAIVVIGPEDITPSEKEAIMLNIKCDKSTFQFGGPYGSQVRETLHRAYTERTALRELKGEDM